MTHEELTMIIAGLELLKEHIAQGDVSDDLADTATCGGMDPMPTVEQIVALSQTIIGMAMDVTESDTSIVWTGPRATHER